MDISLGNSVEENRINNQQRTGLSDFVLIVDRFWSS